MKTTYFFTLPLSIKAKEFNNLSFGRQIEYFKQIEEFKKTAKSIYISQKVHSLASALKEFKALYKPKFFFCKNTEAPYYKDHSIEVWYTE